MTLNLKELLREAANKQDERLRHECESREHYKRVNARSTFKAVFGFDLPEDFDFDPDEFRVDEVWLQYNGARGFDAGFRVLGVCPKCGKSAWSAICNKSHEVAEQALGTFVPDRREHQCGNEPAKPAPKFGEQLEELIREIVREELPE